MDTALRHRALCDELRRADVAYYRDCAPIMSDYQYDMLMRELERIEEARPDLVTPESPTQRVGH